MLRVEGGRSTASLRESGSTAPALQRAKAQILDMSQHFYIASRSSAVPTVHRFTRDECYRMAEAGLFH